MTSTTDLLRAHDALRRDATRLAGGLSDLAQRAAVYHHLFEHSGRNHVFPLIAAHGALWAKGYFAFGMRLGTWLRWQYPLSRNKRARRMRKLHAFADAFREVNRRVCVDTYVSYHFTRVFGDHPQADRFVDRALLEALNEMHAARRAKRELTDAAKRDIFARFFLNEQEYVVGPSVEQAVSEFDWALMRFLALKPVVRFAYFPRGRSLWFGNFADREQRTANGLRAFDWAAAVGWQQVESALRSYNILPQAFFAGSAEHFRKLRHDVLASATA